MVCVYFVGGNFIRNNLDCIVFCYIMLFKCVGYGFYMVIEI